MSSDMWAKPGTVFNMDIYLTAAGSFVDEKHFQCKFLEKLRPEAENINSWELFT